MNPEEEKGEEEDEESKQKLDHIEVELEDIA